MTRSALIVGLVLVAAGVNGGMAADVTTADGGAPRAALGMLRAQPVEPPQHALARLAAAAAPEQAYLDLARLYQEQMKVSEAGEVYDRAVALFPTATAYEAAARFFLAMGLLDRAQGVVDLALADHPSDARLLQTAAAAAMRAERGAEAADRLRASWGVGADPLAWLDEPLLSELRLSEPLRSMIDVDRVAASLLTLDPEAQRDRLMLLAELRGAEAAPAIVETLLASSDRGVLHAGLHALAQLDEQAVAPFATLLERGDATVRLATLHAMRERGLAAFAPLFERQLSNERSVRSYDLAQLALAELAARDADLADAERILRGVPTTNSLRHVALGDLAGLYRQAQRQDEAAAVEREADALRQVSADQQVKNEDPLEEYAQCKNSVDIQEIRELLFQHRYVAPIDARVYGLPKYDFDDQKSISLADRRFLRRLAAEQGEAWPVSGPIQYPREIQHALRYFKQQNGTWVDCAEILEGVQVPEAVTLDWEKKVSTSSGDDNETNVVVNPMNEAYVVGTANDVGTNGNDVYRSSNRGDTFTQDTVDAARGTCDPVSYYNRVGATDYLYHSYLLFNTSYSAASVSMDYSTDNGSTWTDCAAIESATGYDRQDHAVDLDPWGDSTCDNTIYVAYHSSTQYMKASTGATAPYCQSWGTRASGLSSTIGSAIVVATNGRAMNFYSQYTSGIKMMSTTNCGSSWASSTAIVTYNNKDFEFGIPSTCSRAVYHYPQADNDRVQASPFRNRIYLTWNDLSSNCTPPDCTGNTTCNSDVFVAVGTPNNADNPTSWTWNIYNLTDPLTDSYTDEFYPSITVDPADGAVYLSYYRTNSGASAIGPRRDEVHYVVLRSVTGADNALEWQLLQVTATPTCETSACGGNTAMQWGDYTWNDVVNGVAYATWTDRRDDADEDNWIGRVCTEPAHWSERANSPSAPTTNVTDNANGTVDISWAAPDISNYAGTDVVWGDGGDNTAGRHYELWVDGAFVQNVAVGTTTVAAFNPDATTCAAHSYQIRAENGCAVEKLYQTTSGFAATGCETCSPPSGLVNNGAADLDPVVDSGVQVSWAADAGDWGDSGGTRSYTVLRDGNPLLTGGCAGALAYGVTSCVDDTGTNGIPYLYQVRYDNDCGDNATTAGSSAVDEICLAPGGLANNAAADLDALADSGVQLSWTQDASDWGDSGSGTRSYTVLRDGSPLLSGGCAGALAYGVTSCVDDTGDNSLSYLYQVRYDNGCGEATVTAGAPAADMVCLTPSGLTDSTAADLDLVADTGVQVGWAQDAGDWGDLGTGTRSYSVLRDGVAIVAGGCAGPLAYGTTSCVDDSGDNNVSVLYQVSYSNGCAAAGATTGVSAMDQVELLDAVFGDDFESGDSSAWDFTEP